MKHLLKGAALAFTLAASPANAAVVISSANVTTTENVLFASSTQTASPTLIANTNQSKVAVTFANKELLLANASGQSSTENATGVLVGLTSVDIASGFRFSTAEFNVEGIPGNFPSVEASSIFVEAIGVGGLVIGKETLKINGFGENRIGISGTACEMFTGFRITLNPFGTGVDALSQVRLGGVGAVPEPATWMMMLFGFGLIGGAMRRRNTVPSFA